MTGLEQARSVVEQRFLAAREVLGFAVGGVSQLIRALDKLAGERSTPRRSRPPGPSWTMQRDAWGGAQRRCMSAQAAPEPLRLDIALALDNKLAPG